MGLDMMLYGVNTKTDSNNKFSMEFEEVAYWRKANAIHNWFVENIQGSVDNCAYYLLDKSNLEDLALLCKKVLKNPTVENAMELLPTQEGFFFGGTDLTDEFEMEWYLDGLKYTVSIISELLRDNKYQYFSYHSSW